jgi:hypothetical protein
MKRSLETWFAILNRQTNQLKKAGEGQPSKEARPLFENLIVHLKLGWTMFQDESPIQIETKSEVSLEDRVAADFLTATKVNDAYNREHESAVRQMVAVQGYKDPVEETPWWSKPTKYIDFAKYASGVIRASAKKHDVRMPKKALLGDYHKTFVTLIGCGGKEGYKTAVLCNEKTFTQVIAGLLKFSLKDSLARSGNTLSHLLAALEKRLNEVE